jgi:hypothetical protein
VVWALTLINVSRCPVVLTTSFSERADGLASSQISSIRTDMVAQHRYSQDSGRFFASSESYCSVTVAESSAGHDRNCLEVSTSDVCEMQNLVDSALVIGSVDEFEFDPVTI